MQPTARRLCSALLALVAATGCGAGAATLEITAPEGAGPTVFSIACGGAAAERMTTPASLTFDATPLTCEITADGPIEIVARTGSGNVSRSRMSGGTIKVRLS